ncbi:hypothetical protein BHE74_00038877 [Ensete ventricosum]|nr:hypothetical protein BHE74_00038877 [Ensete ventricosum]
MKREIRGGSQVLWSRSSRGDSQVQSLWRKTPCGRRCQDLLDKQRVTHQHAKQLKTRITGSLTLAEERRTGESKSSAGLRPAGMAKQEEGDMGGREIGSDGGGADLNLGTPPPPVPAKSLLIDRPPPPKSSPPPPARSSEKEAYGDEKAKAVGGVELAEVSKLPAGDAMEGWGVGGEEGKRRDEERRREVDRKIKGDWRRGREWLKVYYACMA